MVEMKKIRDLTSLIAREFNPDRIILFGSYAYGQAGYDSDVDILVVLPFKGKAVRKAIKIRNIGNARIPPELIVLTTDQVSKRVAMNHCFMLVIVKEGRTL